MRDSAEQAEEDKHAAADAKRKADLSKRIGKMIQKVCTTRVIAFDKLTGFED